MGQRSGSKQEELALMRSLTLVRSGDLVLCGKMSLAQPLRALKVLRDSGQVRWLEGPLLE